MQLNYPQIPKNTTVFRLKRLLPLLSTGMFILGLLSCSNTTSSCIQLKNTLDITRTDEPIVLKRAFVDKILNSEEFKEKITVTTASGKTLQSQLDDLNLDGEWDELVFQYSFRPYETLTITLDTNDDQGLQKTTPRTHAYLGYRPTREGDFKSIDQNTRPKDHEPQSWPYLYQFEGPGWESDAIAYRIYFDKRNGKDIFGKTKKGIFLDSIGLGENYHKLQPWGMDVLKVGKSLGAGSLAMLKNDSLYRLGQTKSSSYKKIADGPVRAIIKLKYKGWQINDENYNLDETITIWGGKRWYHDQIKMNGTISDTLVTGIVNMFEIASVKKPIATSHYLLANHGKQSENNDILGMAVLTTKEQFTSFGSTPNKGKGITQTDYIGLQSKSGSYQFYFYTGWELDDPKFADKDYFLKTIKHEATKLANPIQITM